MKVNKDGTYEVEGYDMFDLEAIDKKRLEVIDKIILREVTMEKPRKNELLDCPFCGNKALTKIEQPRMDSDNVPKYCKCSYGPCCASKIYWPIEQWNVRSMSTWLEGEVPGLDVIELELERANQEYVSWEVNKMPRMAYLAKAIHELNKRKLTGKVSPP